MGLQAQIAAHESGSFGTRENYERMAATISQTMQEMGMLVSTIEGLKSKHVEQYVEARLEAGAAARTIQNEVSAMRQTCEQYGNGIFAANADRLSSRELGIEASRDGAKTAMRDDTYRQALERAAERGTGIEAVLRLERELGLRCKEAIMSPKSLETWSRAVERGDKTLHLVAGAKGGRERDITIIDREAVREAIACAKAAVEANSGSLLGKDNLKANLQAASNEARACGLAGDQSMHSARYAYAQDALAHHQAQGSSREEALSQTSHDLGHGDGRGRWVEQVYLR